MIRNPALTLTKCIALFALLIDGCHCGPRVAPTTPPREARVIQVPRTLKPIVIDGETDDDAWIQGAFRSEPFEDSRGRQAPFANVSIVADDQALYLWVYVADGDLHSDGDRMTIDVGPLKLVLTPKGGEVPAGVKIATDIDGTVDNFTDDDEEWVTEIAIPWELLKSRRVPFRAVRIDVGKQEERPRAMAWPRDTAAILDFK